MITHKRCIYFTQQIFVSQKYLFFCHGKVEYYAVKNSDLNLPNNYWFTLEQIFVQVLLSALVIV